MGTRQAHADWRSEQIDQQTNARLTALRLEHPGQPAHRALGDLDAIARFELGGVESDKALVVLSGFNGCNDRLRNAGGAAAKSDNLTDPTGRTNRTQLHAMRPGLNKQIARKQGLHLRSQAVGAESAALDPAVEHLESLATQVHAGERFRTRLSMHRKPCGAFSQTGQHAGTLTDAAIRFKHGARKDMRHQWV